MKVLAAEKTIGIKTFFTHSDGVGGKLRTNPEDFVVCEVSNYPSKKDDGRFTIADVTVTHWETNHLVRELSNWLHISRQRIGFAGTKDKRAKSTRLMSFSGVTKEKVSEIKLGNVSIDNIYRSNRPVRVGDLVGNKFEITVRNIDRNVELKQVKDIDTVFEKQGGFPNFYGIQRFGIIRPITHVVGKYIVKDDFEKAVMSYIANPMVGEDEEIVLLREQLQKTRDCSKALKSYPDVLSFEKAILNKLVVDSKDFVGALRELPRNLVTMFVYAYQSHLFNRILSERIKQNLPLNKAIVGDVVLPIRKSVIDEKPVRVKENNIEKVNKQISKGKAAVSSILFGSDSVFSDGEMGEIEHKVIDSEKIEPRDFIIPDIPFVSSSGMRRPLLAFVKDLDFKLGKDEHNKSKQALFLSFELQKGCYATSLIREFMKADDIKNY